MMAHHHRFLIDGNGEDGFVHGRRLWDWLCDQRPSFSLTAQFHKSRNTKNPVAGARGFVLL
ncbi:MULTISPECIES: hypothetical protein, partial [Agrobacterium]|uniref:hypothetical protein n=1 Tax=Agrobacterium TaxID=357 RepID=UPI001ABF70BE